MLSRVADSLYWMSRYLERAEHTARVINVQMDLMLESGAASDDRIWNRALRALGIDDELHASTGPQVLIHDADCASSIVASIAEARENARQVREQISSEMWEQLNRLYHHVRSGGIETGRAQGSATRDFLESIKEGCHLIQGVTDAMMTHGEGWQFIQLGRFLERSVLVSLLVGVHFRELSQSREMSTAEYLEWIGLLRSCTAFEAYCKAYTADLQPVRIAEFLVLHPGFPHSIRFSADAMEKALNEIGQGVTDNRSARVSRLCGKLRASLGFAQIDEIMAGGLHAYLDTVRGQCGQLHSALYQTYISYPVEAALGA